jgi:hypothetical protein
VFDAIGDAKMETLFAERPSNLIAFRLGTSGKVREPFLDSSESGDLVRQIDLVRFLAHCHVQGSHIRGRCLKQQFGNVFLSAGGVIVLC